MGLSNESNNSKVLCSMKVVEDTIDKTKKGFFITKHKVEGKWVEKEKFTKLTAEPFDIELGSYQWQNAPVDTVTMQLMDGVEKIQLEFNLDSGLSRALLNTLLGEEHIGTFAMSLYTNKAGYPSLGVENDGQKTNWKYKFEQFPAVTKNKKGVVIENDAYLEFMRQMVRDIKKKLSGKQPAVSAPKEKGNDWSDQIKEPAGEKDDSGLPF